MLKKLVLINLDDPTNIACLDPSAFREQRTLDVSISYLVFVKDLLIIDDHIIVSNLFYGIHMVQIVEIDGKFTLKMRAQIPLDNTPNRLSLFWSDIGERFLMVTSVSPVNLSTFNVTNLGRVQYARYYSSKRSELYNFGTFVTANNKFAVI